VLLSHAGATDFSVGHDLAERFRREVDMRLDVPVQEQALYGGRLDQALAGAGFTNLQSQYFLLVDRSPVVQAAFIYWLSPSGEWRYIGASPVATGQPGSFDHFVTPTGVFDHTPANMDFRSECTYNEFGIRGYGRKGMRIYDFGCVSAERGWDQRGRGTMRLQMHATDPDLLEPLLGRPHSKGCIRIPATLNTFVDHYGLIDAEYERVASDGKILWLLRPGRTPTPWPGRSLVIVDSNAKSRPYWSPLPAARKPVARRIPFSGQASPFRLDSGVC